MVGEVIEGLVECLDKLFKRTTGKPWLGVELCHDIIREQGFNGGLQIRKYEVHI